MKRNKFFSIYLPIFLAIALIGLFAWFFFKDKTPAYPKTSGVIDLSQPIIKYPDEVGKIEVNSGGGKTELVQLKFSWEIQGIKYNDAINLPKEEFEKLKPEDLERIKNERFYNWANLVNTQSKKE